MFEVELFYSEALKNAELTILFQQVLFRNPHEIRITTVVKKLAQACIQSAYVYTHKIIFFLI